MRGPMLLATAVAVCLACCAAATASRPSLSLRPRSVVRGKNVVVRGSADGCPRGDSVFVLSRAFARRHEFAGVPAAIARVRAGGNFRTTAHIPATRRPGRYKVTARCGGGNLRVLVTLTVRA